MIVVLNKIKIKGGGLYSDAEGAGIRTEHRWRILPDGIDEKCRDIEAICQRAGSIMGASAAHGLPIDEASARNRRDQIFIAVIEQQGKRLRTIK